MKKNDFDVIKIAATGQSAAGSPQHLIQRRLILNRFAHVDDLLHRGASLIRRAAVVDWQTSAEMFFFVSIIFQFFSCVSRFARFDSAGWTFDIPFSLLKLFFMFAHLNLEFLETSGTLPRLMCSFPGCDDHRFDANVDGSEVGNVVGIAVHRAGDA